MYICITLQKFYKNFDFFELNIYVEESPTASFWANSVRSTNLMAMQLFHQISPSKYIFLNLSISMKASVANSRFLWPQL